LSLEPDATAQHQTHIHTAVIPKYFKMYFKYNWSCIYILHFCKSEILLQNTFQVKLCSMLRKKCYQIEFFYSSYKCITYRNYFAECQI